MQNQKTEVQESKTSFLEFRDIPTSALKAYSVPITFTNGENLGSNKLTIKLDGVSSNAIGTSNGIDLDKELKRHETALTKAINRIYDDRNKIGSMVKVD